MADAERAFAEAAKREPTSGLYRYNHGLALQQLGRRDEAAAEFRQAAALGHRRRPLSEMLLRFLPVAVWSTGSLFRQGGRFSDVVRPGVGSARAFFI